jgi:UPF0716 family protein affecting phage T7 exclusion
MAADKVASTVRDEEQARMRQDDERMAGARPRLLGPGAWPVLALAYVAAELFLFTVIAGKIGFILTFLLALGNSALGVALLSTVLRQALAELRHQGSGMMVLQGGRLGRTLLGALMLIVPGFLSGLIGLWLLWPLGLRGSRTTAPDGVVELSEDEWREVEDRARRLRPGEGRSDTI